MTASVRMLPKRIEYSIRALVALAGAAPQTVKAQDVADAQAIPPGYLYDLLADLRRADLVQVQRGTGGGYALAHPPASLTLGEIVRRLDGPGQDPPAGHDDLPPDRAIERLHHLWDRANRVRLDYLDAVTLADLINSH
ncbi:RrF2 family transcriptional regulator [Dactylosporangium sp. CS-047395]|uniref:RrF2 family transcriptional regulator n=1 Tax=Dactylosporangium sp. CS-047395 TaxID=3239936 RepID=UPI003D94D32E